MSTKHIDPIVYFKGDRLYLRPSEPADGPLFQRWINDPDTRRTLGSFRPFTEAAERKFIEQADEDPNAAHFAIVLHQGDRLIGSTALRDIRWKDRCCEFGIMIGDADCRGKGYGTEATRLMLKYAFETLNLNRVQLGVLAFNEFGIRAYERAGFVREGVQREYLFTDGRYVDHVMYSVLAREYFAGRDATQPPKGE